jgi:hypothetical protein
LFFLSKGFNDYMKKLKPSNNKRNPWFFEFWEEQFNCSIDPSISYSQSPRLSKRLCTGEEKLNVAQDGFVHFVIDSVFAMAHAIQNLLNTHCPFNSSLTNMNLISDCHNQVVFSGPEVLKAIRDVEFTSLTGRKVKFLKNKENLGDGSAPYAVYQFQRNITSNKFNYQKIGEWSLDDPVFQLQRSKLRWRTAKAVVLETDQSNSTKNDVSIEKVFIPRSVCKEECLLGEIKQGDDCCWVCVKCEDTQYVSEDRTKCVTCSPGEGPNDNMTSCVKLPIEYMFFSSPFTLVPLVFAIFGIVITSFCIGVFIR